MQRLAGTGSASIRVRRRVSQFGRGGGLTAKTKRAQRRSAILSFQFQPDPLIQRQPAYPKVVYYGFGPNISVELCLEAVRRALYLALPLAETVPETNA
jgi:hypothetical protein